MEKAGQVPRTGNDSDPRELLLSLRHRNDPRGWPDDELVWQIVQQIGFGKMYLRPKGNRILPRKEIEGKIKEIKERGYETKGMTICGPLGTGKTSILCYLAACFVRNVAPLTGATYRPDPKAEFICLDWGMPKIAFSSTGELFELFFDKRKATIDYLKRVSVLMLDDFGREYQTDFPLAKFENFIEYRYANVLTTFITTNIAPVDLADNPAWARIVDRLRDPKWMEVITIKGESMRG